MVTPDAVAVQLERLCDRAEALGREQRTLAALVRQLVDRIDALGGEQGALATLVRQVVDQEMPESRLRTARACALLQVGKSTLYSCERQRLIGRH